MGTPHREIDEAQNGQPHPSGQWSNNPEPKENLGQNVINLTEHILGLDHLALFRKGLGFSPSNEENRFDIYKDILYVYF